MCKTCGFTTKSRVEFGKHTSTDHKDLKLKAVLKCGWVIKFHGDFDVKTVEWSCCLCSGSTMHDTELIQRHLDKEHGGMDIRDYYGRHHMQTWSTTRQAAAPAAGHHEDDDVVATKAWDAIVASGTSFR